MAKPARTISPCRTPGTVTSAVLVAPAARDGTLHAWNAAISRLPQARVPPASTRGANSGAQNSRSAFSTAELVLPRTPIMAMAQAGASRTRWCWLIASPPVSPSRSAAPSWK